MVGASRRRSLLLFHATDLVRSAMMASPAVGTGGAGGGLAHELVRGEALRLRLALRGLEPPDDTTAGQVTPKLRGVHVAGQFAFLQRCKLGSDWKGSFSLT